MNMRSSNARYSAKSGVGRPSGHVRSRAQITRFGAVRGGHARDQVAVQNGGYSRVGADQPLLRTVIDSKPSGARIAADFARFGPASR
jgi:hypothetical protein